MAAAYNVYVSSSEQVAAVARYVQPTATAVVAEGVPLGGTSAKPGFIRSGGGTSIDEWFAQAVPAAQAAAFDVLVGGMYSWAPAALPHQAADAAPAAAAAIEYAPHRYIVAVSDGESVGFSVKLTEREATEEEPLRVGVVWPFLATHADCGGRRCAVEIAACEWHMGESLALVREAQVPAETPTAAGDMTADRLRQMRLELAADAERAAEAGVQQVVQRGPDVVCIACDTPTDQARLAATRLALRFPVGSAAGKFEVFPGIYNVKNRVEGCAASHKAVVASYPLGTTIVESDVRYTRALSFGDWRRCVAAARAAAAAARGGVDVLLGGVSCAVPAFPAGSGSARVPEHIVVDEAKSLRIVKIRGGSGFFFYSCLTDKAVQAFAAVATGKHIDCEVIRNKDLAVYVVHPFIATVGDGISTLSNTPVSHARKVAAEDARLASYFRR